MPVFDLFPAERKQLMDVVLQRLEAYYAHTQNFAVTPVLDPEEIRKNARQFDFSQPENPEPALHKILDALEKFTVHTPHPSYFGLFNPRANFAGIMADLISAVFNIQMAAWSHAPFAVEVENYLIQVFGEKFGYDPGNIDGVFATGGAEANLTAVLCALNFHLPSFASEGLVGLTTQPVMYGSAEAHHSLVKAARTVGLGYHSVRNIPTRENHRMDTAFLEKSIQDDLNKGFSPFMVTGTAGTTGPGAIDDLQVIAAICQKYNLWFHVDAAYGGAVVLHPEFRDWIGGIESSDSITFDVHKWLSVPMACSMFITRHTDILHKTFSIHTGYMPRDAKNLSVTDPFTHSIQWSRRFIGFKLYLSLVIFGWEGYKRIIKHQVDMGNLLKKQLADSNWSIENDSLLPIVCFTDPKLGKNDTFASALCEAVVKSGKAWISVYPVKGVSTLRACITNYATTEKEITELVFLLNIFREKFSLGK
ncbi:MAG: pyridoxal-dependent decarboxylase [Bacteroidia bacterium]|nr:pyridoxal-dependent decarboxylase [Bacteroidia bacterium]